MVVRIHLDRCGGIRGSGSSSLGEAAVQGAAHRSDLRAFAVRGEIASNAHGGSMLSHTCFLPRTKARRTISGRKRLLVPLAAAGILMSAVGCPKLPSAAGTPADIGGVGVMGDSMSDEYRADNNRGGAYASSTFNG